MVDVWPASLPQYFEINGFSEAFADSLIETQPDKGPPQSRRGSTAAVRPVSGSMQCTQAQLDTLRAFDDVTLAGGALPFEMPGATEVVTWLVKFPKGGLPKVTPLGPDHYRVSYSLLILP